MKQKVIILVAVAAIVTGIFVFSCGRFIAASDRSEAATDPPASAKPPRTMRAFRSEQELKSYFAQVSARATKREANKQVASESSPTTTTMADEVASGKADDKESITNTQHAGVDEGGIVKLHGDYLVILRR